jgi:hypothetical protein
MAAISSSTRRATPAWVGTVGMVLGTGLGAAGCWALAHLL